MSQMIKETIEKIAAEKYPEDAQAAEEFVKAFMEKMANEPSIPGSWNKGIGESLGRGVVGLGLGLGVAGVSHVVGGIRNQVMHNKFLQALNEAVQMNVILKKADKQKVLSYGETLFRYAPHVATDANMLAHLLSNAVQGDGIDAQTIRMAADLENRYQQNNEVRVKDYL